VTKFEVRAATEADVDAIAAVAIATGQVEEWSGSDPAYVNHLLAEGTVMVAESADGVTGFGATRRIGDGRRAVSMLCDLFVDPQFHGQGIGQALLAQLWEPGSARMTFSSLHAHAVPVYTRAGLDAWWPLLYLGGNVRVLRRPDGWTVTTPSPALVAALEAEWTGIDRAADHRAWAARPGGQPVIARRGAQPLAAGTVAGADEEYGIVHLALSPAAGNGEAVDAVRAVLASLNPPDGRARVCLPAPHPATRPLLAAGWHVDFMDLFMATSPELLDPRRAVPSSALA